MIGEMQLVFRTCEWEVEKEYEYRRRNCRRPEIFFRSDVSYKGKETGGPTYCRARSRGAAMRETKENSEYEFRMKIKIINCLHSGQDAKSSHHLMTPIE